jgi:serine/threonine protein kinase
MKTQRVIQGKDYLKRKTINQYSILKNLGEGAFAKVKLVQCGEQDQKFAVKIFNRAELKKPTDVVQDAQAE